MAKQLIYILHVIYVTSVLQYKRAGNAHLMGLIRRKLLLCVSVVMGEVTLPLINQEKWVNAAHG